MPALLALFAGKLVLLTFLFGPIPAVGPADHIQGGGDSEQRFSRAGGTQQAHQRLVRVEQCVHGGMLFEVFGAHPSVGLRAAEVGRLRDEPHLLSMTDVNQRFPLGVVCHRVVAGDNGQILGPVFVSLLEDVLHHHAAVSGEEIIDWKQVSLQGWEA